MSGSGARPNWLSFGLGAANLKDRYKRLALVSHPRHLENLDRQDTETLLVVHGWLLWQQTARTGWHSVHYEAAVDDLPSDAAASDIFIRTHDWLHQDGEDPTIFHGVSLGRLFARELSLMIMERQRLVRSLGLLIERFDPKAISYFDFRAEHSVMDEQARLGVVREYAEKSGLTVEDLNDPIGGNDPHLPFAEFYGRHEEPRSTFPSGWRDRILSVFVPASSLIGQALRFMAGRRPSVFVASTHLSALPLIREFAPSKISALVLADWYPNKRDVGFVIKNMLKGVYPATARRPKLNGDQKSTLANMCRRLEQDAIDAPQGEIGDVRRYVAKYIVSSGKFVDMAKDVLWIEKILDRHRPQWVTSDGLDFYLCHILFSLARKRGVKSIATWHGQYIQNVKMWVLGCDRRIDAPIDYFFTWGEINERWLSAIGSTVKPMRSGNPVARRSLQDSSGQANPAKRVLLLQYVAAGEDQVFPQGKQYNVFVDTVSMLHEIGLNDICLKVHPGPYSESYYRQVAAFCDLDVRVVKDTPFQDLVAWADLVIGPAVSGAMLEVLGTGTPFYPLLVAPHAVDENYLADYPVYHDVEELKAALCREAAPDFESLLNGFTASKDIPNAARHTWKLFDQLIETDPRPPDYF